MCVCVYICIYTEGDLRGGARAPRAPPYFLQSL